MVADLKSECSFCSWYPKFTKEALESVILPIPEDVLKYLEHDAFLLPVEATNDTICNSEWADGSPVVNESSEGSDQPSFLEFSKKIKDVIDDFGAVFLKSNWSTPSDATWVAPTKTLKCTVLEEVYLLLKSSDRIASDLSAARNSANVANCCLVLKKWRDINPCTEFRCFVAANQLVGICQRDVSQYYRHIENEKYDIQQDIRSFFAERIQNRFKLSDYSFDVIRYKKDKVKIVDFGLLDESSTKGALFSYEELRNDIKDAPEFRFIAEDMGIQPKASQHFCVPQEINEFFQVTNQMSMMDLIQKEVEEQDTGSDSESPK